VSAAAAAPHGESAVTVATVTFNSAAVVAAALRSAPAQARCIVVDNASADDTIAAARAVRPDAEIVELPRNVGFGAANNAALARCETPFLLMLNPDATLGEGTVAAFLAAAAAHPEIGLFGLGPETPGPETPGPVTPAATLSGACLFARVDAMRAVSGFDEAIFLYFDDDDLCLRMRAAGFGVAAVPGARIDHVSGRSTHARADSALERAWLWGGACAYFAGKHRDAPEGRKAARKLANYRRKALLNRLLRPRGAEDYAARVAGADAVLREGPAVMRENAFNGGPARAGAPRAAPKLEGAGACP
jgi:hypothetical protein